MAGKKKSRTRATQPRFFDTDSTTDNVSRLLTGRGLVPERFRGTPAFLDVVAWNIRWFDHQDPDRIDAITEVLSELNADLLVLTEIADDGALDEVGERLAKRKAGFYSLHYGDSGRQQRVVFMWDRDWVRAKEAPLELFTGEQDKLTIKAEFGTGKARVFPRLPLWGYFEAAGETPNSEGFTFELVGLHLKAQGPSPTGYNGPDKRWGIPQRTKAAQRLAQWLETADDHFDEDVIMVGDWNAKPDEEEWKAMRKLETDGKIDFASINPVQNVTHMARLNKSGPGGTRLDLQLVTSPASANAVPDNLGVVIQWSLFDELEALSSKKRQELFKKLKQRFSDHLPVVSRFYFTDAAGDGG